MLHIGAAGSLLLIYLSININVVDCGINKPLGEWLCDYCSMGWYTSDLSLPSLTLTLTIIISGPPEVKDECGTPILCMFYGLLFFIICLTIYSTARGTKE